MARAIDKDEALYQLERLALEAQMVDECEENTIRSCIAAVKMVPTLTQPKESLCPCDFCVYNPPSSFDGKPCACCPAEKGDL